MNQIYSVDDCPQAKDPRIPIFFQIHNAFHRCIVLGTCGYEG